MRPLSDPPPMPVQDSVFYPALCIFKDAFVRSRHKDVDDRLRDALAAAHPYMPSEKVVE